MSTYSGTFQYTQPTDDYNPSDSPFVNTDGSFTTLTDSTSISGDYTIVSWAYVFDDSGNSSVDGLYLNGTITTPENMTINDFDNIPMSRQGNQFENYTGSFPSTSTNIPTLLPNTSCSRMFLGAINFNQNVGSWDVSTVTNMANIFKNCSDFNQNINNWDISNVTNLSSAFEGCTSFNQNISNWDVSNIASFYYLFNGCTNFNKPLSWTTTNLNNMEGTFINCTSFNQPLNWNTINVTSLKLTFRGCSNFDQDISTWDVSNVTNMNSVFRDCTNFNQPLTWTTSNVNFFDNAFKNCTNFNQNISNWDVSKSTGMYEMFNNSTSFNQNIGNWDISNVVSMIRMLDSTALSVDNYDATLNGWSPQEVQSNVNLGAQGLEYSSSGELGRITLTTTYNWTINGDTLICFIKNTMILILENGIEVERKVQELKNGDMVKISTGEYKKLVFIGTKTINITKNIDKIRIMKKGILGNNLPNKDLLVTSGHSVLFKNLENINEYYNKDVYNNNIDGYYKMMSQHCKLFDYVKEEELENICDGVNVSYYHFCLENEDKDGQYGIYSNGILSETMSLNFRKLLNYK